MTGKLFEHDEKRCPEQRREAARDTDLHRHARRRDLSVRRRCEKNCAEHPPDPLSWFLITDAFSCPVVRRAYLRDGLVAPQ